jgi:CDP-glycerol glycerophosphotransferase
MAVLSVVIVVQEGRTDVEECLRAVLDQSCAQAEVVVVDPAGVVDMADKRLRIHRPNGHADIVAPRELAVGEYVWAIDAIDVLRRGAVRAVVDALEATSPDVLLVSHLRRDKHGKETPGPHAAVVRRIAAKEPAALERHPGAAALARHVGGTVVRRSLLQPISDGPYGALTATWPALLGAERIAALPNPVFVRHASSQSGSPFEVFAPYDAVLALVDRDDLPAARRKLIVPAMVQHELTLLERLDGDERREFIRRMSEAVRARPGSGDAAKGRVARLEIGLLGQGRHRTFEALLWTLGARTRLRRRQKALRRRAYRTRRDFEQRRLERYYRARLRRPLDPDLAVFAAYWYRGYTCNPAAIYEKAREVVPGFRGVWVVKRQAVDSLPTGVEYVVSGTREYYDTIARASYLVNNVNFPNHFVKREGSIHVMTHHGTPLKQMGLDLRDSQPVGAPVDFDALLRRCARWDYSVSSNRDSTRAWARAYPTDYETLEVGYPRNDVLARATGEDVSRIRSDLGLRAGQTAVLYAPTHREYEHGYVPIMDVAAVADALGEDHVLLARLHYFYGSDPAIAALHRAGRLIDVSGHPSVEDLCLAADVLVTDYSSIMFDYAVLDRPIIIHAPDWDLYRRVRGTYFDILEEHPGPVVRTDDEVVATLLSGAADDEPARRDRAAFRARFCAWDDGHAAERVVRRVWLGEQHPVLAASAVGSE